MTRGSVRAHVVRMMLFVLAGLAIQTLYGLVDLYWVGRLGKEAVAAVALSTNLMFVSMAATQTLSVGCVALVAQAAGRKEHDEVQRLFNQAQSLSTCAGLVFLALCLALRRTYAERLAGDAVTAELAASFLSSFLPALALQFTVIGLVSALRGIGDMKPGLIAQTASVLLNMVLAPVLIFGWIGGHPLGVAGASLATLISTLAAVVGLAVYLVVGKPYLRLRFTHWRPDFALWRRMLNIGLPSGIEFLLLSIMMGVIYSVARPFGPQAQAGFGIASRIMQAGFMPAVALSFAVASVVGQNFGARDFARVREVLREGGRITLGVMLLLIVVTQIAPTAWVRAFSDEPAVIAVGADYLRTVSYNYLGGGLVFVAAGAFQGIGNTWPSLLASLLRALAFVLPTLWLSGRAGFALHSVWLVSVAAVVFQLALVAWLLGRELEERVPVGPVV